MDSAIQFENWSLTGGIEAAIAKDRNISNVIQKIDSVVSFFYIPVIFTFKWFVVFKLILIFSGLHSHCPLHMYQM